MSTESKLTNNINDPDNKSLIINDKMSKLELIKRNDQIKKIVNIDKNMASRSLTFSQFGEDETLCRDLLIYICHNYQHNMFDVGKLDITDFCKVMNYQRGNLQVLVDNPYQSKSLNKKEYNRLKEAGEFLWENKLENALYKLNKIEFAWRFSGQSADGTKYTEETGFKFLDSIIVKKVVSGKTQKKIYGFETNQRFIDNLSSWFLSVNLTAFTYLRSYESLYLYLILRRNMQHSISDFKNEPVEFDKLLAFSGYDCGQDRQNKYKITAALNKIRETDTDLNFTFNWVKVKGSSYAYSLYLDFMPLVKSPDVRIQNLLDRFDSRLSYEYINFFRRTFPHFSSPSVPLEMEKKNFKVWLWDLNQNMSEKSAIYRSARIIVLGNKVEIHPNEEIEYFTKHALNSKILYKAS